MMRPDENIIPDSIRDTLEKARIASNTNVSAAIALLREAYTKAEQNTDYTIIAEVLLQIGNQYSILGLYNDIEILLNDAISLCEQHNDTERALHYNEKLGVFYLGQGDGAKAMDIAQAQIRQIEKTELYQYISRAYTITASAHRMGGNLNEAKKSAEQALRYIHPYPDETNEMEARQILGSIYGQMGLYNEALEQFGAIYLHPNVKSTPRLFTNVCGTLSELYTTLGDFSKALELAMEGLRFIKSNDLRFIEASLHSHAGLAYLRMGNFSAALSEYLECKAIRTEIGDKAGIAIINTRLGRLYLDSREFEEALRYGYEALAFSKEHGFGINEGYAYLIIGEVFLSLNEWADAHEYLSLSYKRFSELQALTGLPSVQRSRLYNALITIHKQREEISLSDSYRNELQMLEAEQYRSTEETIKHIRDFEQKRTEEKLRALGIRSVIIPQTDKKHIHTEKIKDENNSIKVQMLGCFRLTVNGKEIQPEQWKRKRNRDVFKYLILNYGQTIPIEKIIDIFWDYDAPANAANIIWNAASVIRTILEPDLPKGANSSYLKAADRSYTLFFGEKGTVDAHKFLEYIRLSEKNTDTKEKILQLEKAITLYEGELLPEDIYEEWTEEKREEIKSSYIQACLECSHYCAQVGNLKASAQYAKKVISADNTYRKAYELFVNVCKEGGNTMEAHTIINKCKTLYRKEYNSTPPTWLEKLEQSLIHAA